MRIADKKSAEKNRRIEMYASQVANGERIVFEPNEKKWLGRINNFVRQFDKINEEMNEVE